MYLKMLADESVEITTKEGKFTLREPTGEEYEQVERLCANIENVSDFTRGLMLVSRSLVKPKLGELDLKKLKVSSLKRLVDGLNLFNEESADFLQDSEKSSTPTSGNEQSTS